MSFELERRWKITMKSNVVGTFGFYQAGDTVTVDLSEAYFLIVKGLGRFVGDSDKLAAEVADDFKRRFLNGGH